jgi:hypothetical protein
LYCVHRRDCDFILFPSDFFMTLRISPLPASVSAKASGYQPFLTQYGFQKLTPPHRKRKMVLDPHFIRIANG